jgi:ATP-binding cassette, subfamily B, bacterial
MSTSPPTAPPAPPTTSPGSAPPGPADGARTDEHPLRQLWRYAGRHRPTIVLASAFSVLNKAMDLAPPFLIGMAVDIVVQREASMIGTLFGIDSLRTQLLVLAAINVVVWVLESLFEYAYGVTWRNLAQTIQHEARLDAYGHVQDLELAYFEDRSTGGLMAVLNDDVNQLERFLDRGANDILQVLTTVVLVGGAFFVLVPTIAPLAFAPIPFILWGSFRFQRRLEPRYATVRDKVGLLNSSLANNLGGIATIKAFTAEDREVARIGAESDDYRDANRAAIRLSSAFVPLIRMAILAGFVATLVLGGLRALDGALAVGTYSVMVFITQRLLWPLTRLGETFDDYQRAMASVRRLMGLLDVAPTVLPGARALPEPVRGEVAFGDVHFAYKSGPEVLHGLDLHIAPGETHAIVGATGAGKSTVVKLLLRLYDPTAGRITVDGVNIRELTFEALRGPIGLVSQDVFLFHGTVRENIAYGDPTADDEAIRRAADLAEASEFIAALPQGFDTVVGERGQKLSGGQRQRVSIARAILRDPAILVLDEATSAVDNETEAAIQRSLARVSRDRTTIAIAHRLSTIRHAHRIHVMEAGAIVEAGTHEELVALGGRYAALWQVQTGEVGGVGDR